VVHGEPEYRRRRRHEAAENEKRANRDDFAPGAKRYSVTFANGGGTPAYELFYKIWAGVIPTNKPIDAWDDDLRSTQKTRNGVRGDYLFKEHTKTYLIPIFTVAPEQSAEIANGKSSIIFYGTMTYRDVFGCWHHAASVRRSFPKREACPVNMSAMLTTMWMTQPSAKKISRPRAARYQLIAQTAPSYV
jgi:hypothetical protein